MPHAIASMAGDIAHRSPWPEEAEAATFSLSGFVDAQISRDPVHRHNRALTLGQQLDFLAGSVLEAWEERPSEEPIYRNSDKRGTNLVSRVETLLGKLGDEAVEKPDNVSVRLDSQLDISSAAQFSAREAARRELDELKEKAALNPNTALTPLEDRVLKLKLDGYTHAEIGAEEGFSEDKSQKALALAKTKLKWAAGE
jgi:DNA-binding CsgD family transcriptional regulator